MIVKLICHTVAMLHELVNRLSPSVDVLQIAADECTHPKILLPHMVSTFRHRADACSELVPLRAELCEMDVMLEGAPSLQSAVAGASPR